MLAAVREYVAIAINVESANLRVERMDVGRRFDIGVDALITIACLKGKPRGQRTPLGGERKPILLFLD